MEKFRVKYSGANSLIEFYGDHRAENYPNVSKLLADALGAMPQKHPALCICGVVSSKITNIAILSSPEVGVGVFFMVPFALLVILPEAVAAYVVGRIISAMI